MTERENPSSATIGFLTVVEHADHGRFGGYLLLNTAGRPLEFHCTAPVKPSRAQEILFGPTLGPYLEGELIAGALLNRGRTPPLVVCTDRPPILEFRPVVDIPVLLSLAEGAEAPPGLAILQFGANRVAALDHDRRLVEASCRLLLAGLDLHEPFSRIREALDEARSSAAAKTARANAA
jgi:hypothetical protein